MKSPGTKGAEFERACCKRLSLFVTNGRRDDCFWRTAMSGGRATFQLQRDIINRAQAGDLTAISAETIALCERYLFECKHRANLDVAGFVMHGTGRLARFWQATQNVAAVVGKQPILIAKQNFYDAIILAPMDCTVFRGEPWLIWPLGQCHLHWFDVATAVERPPPIKRPIMLPRTTAAAAQ